MPASVAEVSHWFVLSVVVLGCGGGESGSSSGPSTGGVQSASGGSSSAAPGTEGGACYSNGICNQGLACVSDLCVGLRGSGGASDPSGAGGMAAGAGGTSGSVGVGGTFGGGPDDAATGDASTSTSTGGAPTTLCGSASHLPQCVEYATLTCDLCDPGGCNESQICYALNSCDSLYDRCQAYFDCALMAKTCRESQACTPCQL